MTTENNAAPSGLTDEQKGALRWALSLVERHGYESGSVYDTYAKAFHALLAAAPKAAEQAPIAGFDDGSKVLVDSWTGGAHDAGSFGGVTLRFVSADGAQRTREYRALDIAAAEQAPVADAARGDERAAFHALQRLESACDQRAALLTPEAYLAAEKIPGMREALYELDAARKEACEVLATPSQQPARASEAISDEIVTAWADRHDIKLSGNDLRAAFDDAASSHLIGDGQ